MNINFDAIVNWASYVLPNYYIWRMPCDKKQVFLTFDDGPTPELTEKILDILTEKNVHATFFSVGHNVFKYPYLYKLIIEKGHAVGNHTYHHLKGWSTSVDLYVENVKKASSVINSKLFRPPYGKITFSQARILKSDYNIIMWSLLTKDYDINLSPENCLNRAKKLKKGDIVVFHDNVKASKNMLYALPLFIDFALEKGFEFKKL